MPNHRQRLIRENPGLVKQIINFHNNATEHVNEHLGEANEVYSKKIGWDVNRVKESIKSWDGRWISEPHAEIPSIVKYAPEDYDLKYINKNLTGKGLFDIGFYDS